MNIVSSGNDPVQNYFATLGADYITRGYQIVPIAPGQKRPIGSGWQELRLDIAMHARRASGDAAQAGIGILTGVPSATDPAVAVYLADVDTRNEQIATGMRDWLNKNLGSAPERVGLAPKFGAVFSAPPGAAKITSSKFYDPGHVGEKNHAHMLEWLGAGQQFVTHGVHPVTGKPYVHSGDFGTLETLCPDELPAVTDAQKLEAIAEFERLCRAAGLVQASGTQVRITADKETSDPARDLAWRGKPDITLEQVKDALAVLIDEVDDYDPWIKAGMACHYQGHGTAAEGDWLDLWDEWSSNGTTYQGRGEIEDRWKGFSTVKGNAMPTTVATILAMARDARARIKYSAVDQYKQMIEAADTEQKLRDGVCTQIASDTRVEAIDREGLVGLVQARMQELTGAKPPIPLVRGLLRPPVTLGHHHAAEWARPWVWSTEDDTFFNTQSKERYTKISFDAAYNRFCKAFDEKGKPIKVRASDIALDKWKLPVVSGVRYLPGYESTLTMDGRVYANSYRADLIPEVPPVNSSDDDNAIAAVRRHLELLVPDEAHRTVLIQALAWIATHPGRKMHWAPLIKGIEGDGKSVLARLLASVMGHPNVRVLSAETLSQSSFTGWMENNCVIVIEELIVKGGNRHEVMNKLKPIITNDYIEIHPKGRDPYTAPNTSNIIAMTNYEDAIPLTDTDRRWFVLFSPWGTIADLADALRQRYGLALDQHWDELWDGVNHHAGALRGWLESVELSTFQPFARAPDTHYKAFMIAEEISDVDLAIKDILEEGGFGTGQDGIALGPLVSEAARLRTYEKPQSRRLSRAMKAAGFNPHPTPTIKYEGKSYRLYVTTRWANATIDVVSGHLRAQKNGRGSDFTPRSS